MNCKFASNLLLFTCLISGSGTSADVHSQVTDQAKPLVVFATAPKLIAAALKTADGSTLVVRVQATLNVAKANDDDSLTSTLVYRLPDETRQKISQISERKLAEIPISVAQKDLTVNFRRGTACPLIKLQIPENDVKVGNTTLHFDAVALDIHETPDQINQLFCSWTRQINAKRQRLGIIAAINRLITVEEDVENKPVKP